VGQSANHSCCKRHQNVELQFITVQAMQEDDNGNALTTVKPDVAAVLRAKCESEPSEFIRYQYTDQSEHLKMIFECDCYFHVGLCQPHGQKSMLEWLAAAPKKSFLEIRTPKVGATVIVKTGFWQSWVKENEPQHVQPVKCIKWVCMKEEPVWGNEVVNDKLSAALVTCFSGQTVAALGFTALSQQSRDIPLTRADLPKQHVTNSALQGLQLMTSEYIKSKAGFYMTLESFSNSRRCERMIAKIKFPVPIHLLNHLVIPILVRDSHWFPAHMDVKS